MHKPKSLRQALFDALPQLSANPERLHMSIESGNIDARLAASLSFEKRYTLNVRVSGFTGESDALLVPVMAWLRENQPDTFTLEEGRKRGFAFQMDTLDAQTTDVTLSLLLSERILVTEANGALNATYSPEPTLPEPVTRPKALYLNGELISEWEA